MCKHISKKLLCLSVIIMSGVAFAKQPELKFSWLQRQILQHPEVVAAKEAMNGDLYLASALEQPTYNPTLDSGFEREGSDNNYSFGISQTLDRSNKHDSRKQQAVFARIVASLHYEMIVQEKTAQVLNKLNQWQATNKQSALISQQEKQLEDLLDLVKVRQGSGDLGQLDAELAYLSLSQRFGQSARVQAQLKRIESQIRELLPDWQTMNTPIPEDLWRKDFDITTISNIDNHPLVLAAKARWQVAQLTAELAGKNKKADPTIGVNVGKVANDNLLALSFSMPLNIRNNYSAEYKAANAQALSAESNYQAVKRKQQFAIQSSLKALSEYQHRYKKWQSLMQGRDKNSENLLQMQWAIGDLSTTEYLLTLQQRTEGLLAGIDLATEYQQAFVQLLFDSAQLTNTIQINTEK